MTGLDLTPAAAEALLTVDIEGWTRELPLIAKHFEKFGAKLPQGLKDELKSLEQRLQSAGAGARR